VLFIFICVETEVALETECFIATTPKRVTVGTSMSPSFTENSPRKVFLKKVLENTRVMYKHKIKILRQTIQRKNKRIAQMQSVLVSLRQKNFLSDEHLNVLETLGTFNQHLLKRQCAKSKKVPLKKKYSPELRHFALTLHYYSPRAYMYVRSKFDTCLPHPKTLAKWYMSINVEPGFHTEALKSIAERAKTVSYPLFGALIFDEMAIRQHVEYDGSKFSGYVDMGPNIECSEAQIAKEALVFVVNCINESWKIPIGFFFVSTVGAEQKCNLVIQALTLLHNHGMNVISITFDGAPSNISMCNKLGCNLNVTCSFQTHFKHPDSGEPVVLFFYPCHALKLFRNCLAEHTSMVDDKGDLIQWRYFVELNNLQEQEKLHLGNKLRKRHILFYKQKMKVKLASQTFSTSVADALQICDVDLQLTGFAGCASTIRAIRLINDLFNILNTRSIKHFQFKQSLHEGNDTFLINLMNASNIFQNCDNAKMDNY